MTATKARSRNKLRCDSKVYSLTASGYDACALGGVCKGLSILAEARVGAAALGVGGKRFTL